MPAVHTKTREEYDELIEILDKKEAKWDEWQTVKEFDAWKAYEDYTCVDINDINNLLFAPLEYDIEEWSTILSLNEYKSMNDIKECEFKRGEVILVRDYISEEYDERIFLAYIEWMYAPYICVRSSNDGAYTKWKPFDVNLWKYAKKKPTPSSEEIENAKKLLIETWEKWSTF